jgi:cytochrome c peroxidase
MVPEVPAPQFATLAPTTVENVGKAIFFDEDLSINGNQSCASLYRCTGEGRRLLAGH